MLSNKEEAITTMRHLELLERLEQLNIPAEILIRLRNLLSLAQKEQQQVKDIVEEIRKKLSTGLANLPCSDAAVYEVLLALSKLLVYNNQVFESSGYQLNIHALIDWHNTRGHRSLDQGSTKTLYNPYTGEKFSAKDDAAIRRIAEEAHVQIKEPLKLFVIIAIFRSVVTSFAHYVKNIFNKIKSLFASHPTIDPAMATNDQFFSAQKLNFNIQSQWIKLFQEGNPEEISQFFSKVLSLPLSPLEGDQKTRFQFVSRIFKEILSLPLTELKETALHIAVQNNPKIIPTLLEYGANPNIQDAQGRNALRRLMDSGSIAAQHSHMTVLIQYGADRNTKKENGQTALNMLECFRHKSELEDKYLSRLRKWLLKDPKYNGPNVANTKKLLRLLQSPDCVNNTRGYLVMLLAFGADPTIKDEQGRTALRSLMDSRNITAINSYSLITYGADPNTKSEGGGTVLHMIAAVRNGSELNNKYIPKLLKLGADPTIKDNEGYTAFDYLIASVSITEENGYMMMQYGAKLNYKLINNWAPKIPCTIRVIQGIEHRFRRNLFLNLLILLVFDRKHKDSQSYFKKLDMSLFLHIVSFLDFDSMGKKREEGVLLAGETFSQEKEILEMAGSPGGVHVLQRKIGNRLAFKFFKASSLGKIRSEKNTENKCYSTVEIHAQ
jgi:ankyrin repeat protein